jgi:hypothetical protein
MPESMVVANIPAAGAFILDDYDTPSEDSSGRTMVPDFSDEGEVTTQ